MTDKQPVRTVDLTDAGVVLLDQRLLPGEERWLTLKTVAEVADAIRTLTVRGAPAIGVAAAAGMALAARQAEEEQAGHSRTEAILEAAFQQLWETRPTAVNLHWALRRMHDVATEALVQAFSPGGGAAAGVARRLEREALAMAAEDVATNEAIGRHGAPLIPDGAGVLTHCNTGSLATVHYGTALGVIRSAHAAGKNIHVYVDETRPVLQGSRLTAWELVRDGIPATLITDNMAAWFMRQGNIQAAIVGADRIAANGDTANKIGTYGVAVLCKEHGLPFYVAAPYSTVDLSLASGDLIPIEERDPAEVTRIAGRQIAPDGIAVANPAFDVTPHALITAIITERGVVRPPFAENLKALLGD